MGDFMKYVVVTDVNGVAIALGNLLHMCWMAVIIGVA